MQYISKLDVKFFYVSPKHIYHDRLKTPKIKSQHQKLVQRCVHIIFWQIIEKC